MIGCQMGRLDGRPKPPGMINHSGSKRVKVDLYFFSHAVYSGDSCADLHHTLCDPI